MAIARRAAAPVIHSERALTSTATVPAGRPPWESEGFDAARRLVAARRQASTHPLQLVRALARANDVVAASRYVRGLPLVAIAPSDTTNGRWLASRVDGRVGAGLARAALLLDGTVEGYLAGRRKQALRTNLRRARNEGFTAHVACESERARLEAQRAADGRAPMLVREQQDLLLLADGDGVWRGYCLVTRDGELAYLERFVRRNDKAAYVLGRNVLQVALVEHLLSSGVRLLLTGSALTVRTGTTYFQYLAGYDIVNVRVRRRVGADAPVQGAFHGFDRRGTERS